MSPRIRPALLLLAIVLALAVAAVATALTHGALLADGARGFVAVAVLVFVAVYVTGFVVTLLGRRILGDLAATTQKVVRDTSLRVPIPLNEPGDELRQLSEWINFLAEDAHRSHAALAREKLLLAAVAEGLNQGVIAVDDDHRIELLNAAARRMLGVSSTPVGEPLIEVMRVPQAFELIETTDAGEAEVQLPGGPRVLIRAPRTWEGAGRVLLLEDVTTVRRLETVRRDFVANVSHELRTPVAVIRANAETLLAGAKDDPVMGPKLIDGLHRNAERLARILADLLDLSRLDAGQYRMELGDVRLGDLVEQALTAIETPAAARGVTVAVEVPDGLVVRADPKALDQILVNLFDNAVKYTRAQGHVWIEARPVGDRVRVEIRDDGPGIADKHRERIFERFYRADPSRARDAGGTGLGLSIVKHLTESMRGAVGVAPNTPQGSTFWLELPRGIAA